MSALTSDRVSSIAARYAKLTSLQLKSLTASPQLLEQTVKDIKALAASCLRQDEHTGLRKLLRKVAGR